MRLSPNITYEEAFKSQAAIRHKLKNTTNDKELLLNMQHVAENIFEPIRRHFNIPIGVSSFYRTPELNTIIGGAKNSQHTTGEAIDIDADIFGKLTNSEIFNYVKDNLVFDQLIWEFGNKKNPAWVHVSLKRKGVNRKQILYL
jgi:zinc D-Ala-D-Ala carboxypeptidase